MDFICLSSVPPLSVVIRPPKELHQGGMMQKQQRQEEREQGRISEDKISKKQDAKDEQRERPQEVTAGLEYKVECVVVGARPAPDISWWVGGHVMPPLQAQVTVSTLRSVLVRSQGQYQVLCQPPTCSCSLSLT